MAAYTHKGVAITADKALGNAGEGVVSRWIIHVTALVGTWTVAGAINGTGDTAVTITAIKRADGTTVTSIAATGLYDVDAAGLDVTLVKGAGTSMTFSAVPVFG